MGNLNIFIDLAWKNFLKSIFIFISLGYIWKNQCVNFITCRLLNIINLYKLNEKFEIY